MQRTIKPEDRKAKGRSLIGQEIVTSLRPPGLLGRIMDERLLNRFWEVDFLRGIAVAMMVLYHFVFDLNYFGISDFDIHVGFWFYFAHLTAFLFVLLVGVSLVLSHERMVLLGQGEAFLPKLLKRGIWILFLAMAITLVTYAAVGNGFIVFGALHLIGVSLILACPFLRLGEANGFLGLLVILIGLYLQSVSVGYPWLLWLGLSPVGFYSLDYLPLFPWFGVVLLGIAVGDIFYQGYRRRISLPELSSSYFVKPLAFMGKNSLIIYLIHQPILIAILYLEFGIGMRSSIGII
jgi:uncharacterized membrane protein